MKLKNLWNNCMEFTNTHSLEIMTTYTILGLIFVGVKSYQGGMKATEILERHHDDIRKAEIYQGEERVKEVKKHTAKELLKTVAAPTIVGATVMVSSLGVTAEAKKRIFALSSALTISESIANDLRRYKRNLPEVVGKAKAQKVEEAVTREKMKEQRAFEDTSCEIQTTGNGDIKCKDLCTGVWFYSCAESLGKAINALSAKCMGEIYVDICDFYDFLGIRDIPGVCQNIGYDRDDLIEGNLPITYTAFMDANGDPCLALNYEPRGTYELKRWR